MGVHAPGPRGGAVALQGKGIAQEELWAEPLAGVGLFELGDVATGLSRTEAGLEAIAATHSPLLKPFYLHAYAGMLVHVQSCGAAEAILQEEEASGRVTSQHAYDAEVHRLRGDLCAARGHADAAEREFLEAMALAGQQGAFWHRFRAAISLARLLLEHGRRSEARDVLNPAFAAVSPDESCPDVLAARALLA